MTASKHTTVPVVFEGYEVQFINVPDMREYDAAVSYVLGQGWEIYDTWFTDGVAPTTIFIRRLANMPASILQ